MSVTKLLGLLASLLFFCLIGCGGGGGSSAATSASSSGTGGAANLPTVTGLQLSERTITVAQGTSHQLRATALFSDGNRLDVTSLVGWSSTNPAAATVQDGLVRALTAGGEVEVVASHSGFTDRCRVTLTNPVLLDFTVSPNPLNLPAGLQDQLVAIGEFSDGSRPDITQDVDWVSDDTSLATVNNTPGTRGKVTGVVKGDTVIRGTFRGQTVNVTIHIGDARLVGIDVDPPKISLARGVVRQFRAFGQFSDGVPRELTTQVTWSSTNTNRAEVSNLSGSQGTVLAANLGDVEIHATLGAVIGKSELTITAAELISIRLEPVNSSLPKGLRQIFKAYGTFTDNTNSEITDQVTWSTDDPSVAEASNASGSQGQVTGLQVGKVQVKATLFAIEGTTDLNVTTAVLTGLQIAPVGPVVSLSARSQAFTVNGTFSDGLVVDVSASAAWQSSNTTVASIAPGGLATFRGTGTTEIQATLSSLSSNTQLQIVKLTGQDWTRRQGTDRVFSGVFSNGKYYFGTATGVISSSDRQVWKPTRLADGDTVTAMLEAEGRILAVQTRGQIHSSSDGENWTLISTVPSFRPDGIAFGDGLYVAVGQDGKIFTSPNAIQWTPQNSGTTRNLRGVTFGNGAFVAVDDTNSALHSTDGSNWTSRTVSGTIAVTFGNGLFVAVGNFVSTSPDGLNWSNFNPGTGTALTQVAFLNGRFVATSGHRVLRSTNGSSWSSQNILPTGNSFNEILFGNGQYLVGGFQGTPFYESQNLTAWTQTGYPSRASVASSVAYGNGRYVIPWSEDQNGQNPQILTSADGLSWTGIPVADTLDQVVFDGTQFLAVGDGVVATSSDGMTWNFNNAAGLRFNHYNSLVFGNGRYLTTSNSTSVMRTSTDGLVWTPVNFGSDAILGLTFGGGKFVGVAGSGGRIYRSDDGLIWNFVSVPGVTNFYAVTFGTAKYVAVGGNSQAATSPDAINWTLRDSKAPQILFDVTFANGLFVAVGGHGYLSISPDGITWTLANSDTLNFLQAVVGGVGQFVAVGQTGDILTSP